jgi:hypothetical protein
MQEELGYSRNVIMDAIGYLQERGAAIEYNHRSRSYCVSLRRLDWRSFRLNQFDAFGFFPREERQVLRFIVRSRKDFAPNPSMSRLERRLVRRILDV